VTLIQQKIVFFIGFDVEGPYVDMDLKIFQKEIIEKRNFKLLIDNVKQLIFNSII